MVIEENALKTKATYNDDYTHRYSLVKTWDSKLPKLMVIMINPTVSSISELDLTTMLVVNNVSKLGYGSVTICNLFSSLNSVNNSDNSENDVKTNFDEITRSAKAVSEVVIAWGSVGNENARISKMQKELLKTIKVFDDKLRYIYIANPKNETVETPLYPLVRSKWILKPFDVVSAFRHSQRDKARFLIQRFTIFYTYIEKYRMSYSVFFCI